MSFSIHSQPAGAHSIRDAFRLSLRGYASTVSIIASEKDGYRAGLVATAFMSVSLDPPMLAVAINQTATSYPTIVARGAFSINTLGTENSKVSNEFALSKGEEKFADMGWTAYEGPHATLTGVPYLETAQAAIFCETQEVLTYGSHSIFLASVVEVKAKDSFDPLLYCSGQYGAFMTSRGH